MHDVSYTCFFSSAARVLSATSADQARLQVKLLFGTGSEYYRHGVCGAVENATQPTLLIVIGGIEPQHKIKFWNPARSSETRELDANNRWGVGITTASIETAITRRYGRLVNYDISVCAAFSTGYLGLQDSIVRRLFPVDRLDRVIFYDCLYGSLKSALQQVKALRNSVQIVAYVVTEKGNSFQSGSPASFATLELGRIPGWHYINLFGNVGYHAIASARVVSTACSPAARILDPIPGAYETALNGMVAAMPARNTLVSDGAVFARVNGSSPTSTVASSSRPISRCPAVLWTRRRDASLHRPRATPRMEDSAWRGVARHAACRVCVGVSNVKCGMLVPARRRTRRRVLHAERLSDPCVFTKAEKFSAPPLVHRGRNSIRALLHP